MDFTFVGYLDDGARGTGLDRAWIGRTDPPDGRVQRFGTSRLQFALVFAPDTVVKLQTLPPPADHRIPLTP